MGAYSELRIGQLGFDWWKNDIDPSIMVLFTKADKQVSAISLEDWMAAGGDKDAWSPDRCEVKYICSIAVMRDRLDLKGFTLAVAEESFRLGVQRRVPELTESIQGFADPEMITLAQERGLPYPDPDYAEHERKTLEILQEITPQAWCEALRSAADHLPHSLVKYADIPELAPALQSVLVGRGLRFGFPGQDPRCMIRLALEAFDDAEFVTYDLTDLVMSGCFDAESEMIEYAEYLISREYHVNQTTVILTEGSTDRWILERSMRLLYPHLMPFFSFMNFDSMRIEGGAGALANMVKAFAGAGILNRVIALFDNDTAANNVIQNLKSIPFPPNIKILSLPVIESAKHYPTLGPAGVSYMDINGLACGIELYL